MAKKVSTPAVESTAAEAPNPSFMPVPNAADQVALLRQAIASQEQLLEDMRRERAIALKAILSSPAEAAARVREVDKRLDEDGRILFAMSDALADAEQAALEARRQQALASSKIDRAMLVELAADQVAAAQRVDAAFAALADALRTFARQGDLVALYLAQIIAVEVGNDTMRAGDVGAIVMPYASGRSMPIAQAFAARIKGLMRLLDSPVVERIVEVDAAATRGIFQSFERAQQHGAEQLRFRYGRSV